MSDASTARTALNPEGEAAWLRLKLHLEWLESFDLVFIFSAHPAVVRVFRERLAAIHRARVTGLEVAAPQTPAELMDDLLPRLLRPMSDQQALNAPLWLDLTRIPAGVEPAAWRDARLRFLARLNERREPLRWALTRPLVLVLPLAEKARIKALAPDLWAIRRFSIETGNWLTAGAAAHPPPEDPSPFPLSDTERSQVHEWQRLRQQDRPDRGALLAAERAYSALLRRGHIREAAEAALWMAGTARRRLRGDGDEPEALRDLSISLDNVGNTDQALGAWESARAAFTEGLEIGERLAAALPSHLDYKGLPEHFRRRLTALEAAGVT